MPGSRSSLWRNIVRFEVQRHHDEWRRNSEDVRAATLAELLGEIERCVRRLVAECRILTSRSAIPFGSLDARRRGHGGLKCVRRHQQPSTFPVPADTKGPLIVAAYETQKPDIAKRLARIEGQVRGIAGMIDRYQR